jgi:XTP/dITP diphosphohydrolase
MVLATSNVGKRRELMQLLPEWVSVLGLDESGVTLPPETADTFTANACIKAAAAADQTGLLAIADDSGLEVDALDGRPGVHSARFAGEAASDEANRRKLLAELLGTEPAKRSARFVCAVAVARPGRILALAEGDVPGNDLGRTAGEIGIRLRCAVRARRRPLPGRTERKRKERDRASGNGVSPDTAGAPARDFSLPRRCCRSGTMVTR